MNFPSMGLGKSWKIHDVSILNFNEFHPASPKKGSDRPEIGESGDDSGVRLETVKPRDPEA